MPDYRCILAVDTSSLVQSIALMRDERLLAERVIRSHAGHASALLGAIDGVLADGGVALSEVDLLAVGAGPGSFTGLRIGLASLKAVAFVRRLPLVSVSSLEALAWGVGAAVGRVVPLFDARKGQLYASVFQAGGGELVRLTEDLALDPEELGELLARPLAGADGGVVTLCGEAAARFEAVLGVGVRAGGGRVHVVDGPLGIVRASQVALLAARRATADAIPDLATLEPNYQRASEAELHRAARGG